MRGARKGAACFYLYFITLHTRGARQMTGNMKTFTVTIGRDIPQASALGYPCAWLVCTADSGQLRMRAQPAGRGGLLGLYTESGLPADFDGQKLARELQGQMRRFGCGGLLLDLPSDPGGRAFTARLAPQLAALGLVHYVPVELAGQAPQAKLILPSAISGGSFEGMLRHFTSLYPPSQLCLELIRTRNDFLMPSPDADGTPLSAEQFAELQARAGGSYYARELCCRYFTYLDDERRPHFVMFDDAATAQAKALQAAQAGLFACFALYAEWGGDIRTIFA